MNILASGSADNSVSIWDINQLKQAQCYKLETVVTQVQFHSSLSSILNVALENSNLNLIDCRTEKVIKEYKPSENKKNKISGNLMCFCNSEFNTDICYLG